MTGRYEPIIYQYYLPRPIPPPTPHPQVAVLSNTSSQDLTINAGLLTGDRSGLLHVGRRQTFAFSKVDTYIPVNIMAYQ